MRLRKKTWGHYGIDADTKEKIIAEMRENPTQVDILIEKCKVPYGITANVREWILNGTSYYRQSRTAYIPITDADFYGWTRKVVAMYYAEMKEEKP